MAAAAAAAAAEVDLEQQCAMLREQVADQNLKLELQQQGLEGLQKQVALLLEGRGGSSLQLVSSPSVADSPG
eukprot:SAG31_NODE_15015_length_775_cov_1.359467_1_plen_71_part_10